MADDAELFQTSQCLCLASRRAARAITRQFDRALRTHGIKATQFTLLASLTLKGPQPIGALAEFLDADRTTLTRNIQVAAGLGLVSITPGEDARARIVSVTAQGRQVLKRAFPIWRKVQAQLTDTMGKAAADSLRRLSDRSSQRRPQGARSLET